MVLLDQEKINHLPAITFSVVLPILGSPVSGLRFGSRLMEYDLEPLRETELSDLRADGIFQAPIMNLFSFFSGGMGRGAKQKEIIISPHSSFSRRRKHLTTIFIFFQKLMKFSMRLI